jgi:hypothetical protein
MPNIKMELGVEGHEVTSHLAINKNSKVPKIHKSPPKPNIGIAHYVLKSFKLFNGSQVGNRRY